MEGATSTLDTVTALLDILVPHVAKVRHSKKHMAWHPTRSPDIMECKDENGGCDQICIDFPGGYSCSCRAGFTQLTSDRSSCSGMGTDMITL